jgi:hypothetical protein
MPKHNDPQVDRFVQDHPEYSPLFENHLVQPPDGEEANTFSRKLDKVDFEYDPTDRVNTDHGVVFKDPGFKFYKQYDDGSRDNIDKHEYQTMKMFNSLPAHLKSKFVKQL